MANRASRGFALPAQGSRCHITELEAAAGDREVTLIALGGVDPFAGSGEYLTIMDFTPAAQALAVWLELRIHRPDLLGAVATHEDDRDISEDQAG